MLDLRLFYTQRLSSTFGNNKMAMPRSTIIPVIIGAVFMVFAVWLYATPRVKALSDSDGDMWATISWIEELDGQTYSVHQYDKGSQDDGTGLFDLPATGFDALYEVDDHGVISARPEGSNKTFTSICIADVDFTLPFGIDRVVFMLGLIFTLSPRLISWHKNTRKVAEQVEAPDR